MMSRKKEGMTGKQGWSSVPKAVESQTSEGQVSFAFGHVESIGDFHEKLWVGI
jgi:hypothetical protein